MPDYSLECPNCGEASPATARFCGSCQTQLSSIPQSASDAGAQSAYLAGSQPTSISPAKTSIIKKVLGGVAIAWGVIFVIGGFMELSEGDIDFGLMCLVAGVPIYGGINMIRNKRFLGMRPGVVTIVLLVLGMILFSIGSSFDDVSPT